MYNQNTHPQVIYSLNTLSDALFELMKHFPLEDITVTMLCDRANITRKTFYRNCESKQNLIDYRTDRVIHDLLIRVHWDSTDPVMLYRNFFTYWGGQSALLTVLHTQEQFVLFTERFTDSCIRNVTYHFIDDFLDGRENQNKLRLFHTVFLIGGLCSVLECWIKDGYSTSIEELVETVSALSPEYNAP